MEEEAEELRGRPKHAGDAELLSPCTATLIHKHENFGVCFLCFFYHSSCFSTQIYDKKNFFFAFEIEQIFECLNHSVYTQHTRSEILFVS